jgi:soluble lytic murein transglycosylase-like protein
MFFPQEIRTRKLIIKKSIGYGFALTLGILVCIADIKLPTENKVGGGKDRMADLTFGSPAWPEAGLAAVDEPEIAYVCASVYNPSGEPEMYPFELIVHEAAGRYDVDPDLLLAVIMVESRFNPAALSRKGAKGLMQLMPITATALDIENVYSPEENVKAGARHLKWLIDRFDGDVKLALAAYNAGLKNVLRYDGIPPYQETKAYVAKVMEYYAAIKDDSFGF